MNNPIGFFDSGIGGTTILREVIKHLPKENYIYYSDSLNNPYGNKTKEELFTIVDNIVKQLISFNCKIIVCACNTATTMVLNDIRKQYPNTIFIGTEPAIKVVYDKYKDKNAVILTTKGTAESSRFQILFNKYKTDKCTLIKAPQLASLIENDKDTYNYLNELLNNYKNIEVIVLGCTHFPLAISNIKKILGNNIICVDGSIGIANRIENILKENNILNNNGHYLKIISQNKKTKNRILKILK